MYLLVIKTALGGSLAYHVPQAATFPLESSAAPGKTRSSSPFSRWQCWYLFQGDRVAFFKRWQKIFQGAGDTFFKVGGYLEEAATYSNIGQTLFQGYLFKDIGQIPFSRYLTKPTFKDIGQTLFHGYLTKPIFKDIIAGTLRPSFWQPLLLRGCPSAKLPRSCQWSRNNVYFFWTPPQSASLSQAPGGRPPNKILQGSWQ